jgi:uncharacterized protein (DUF1778 family)
MELRHPVALVRDEEDQKLERQKSMSRNLINVDVKPEHVALWDLAAKLAGISRSEWIRRRLLWAAEQEIADRTADDPEDQP